MTKRTRASKRATNHFILNWNKMFERRRWRAARATAAYATATRARDSDKGDGNRDNVGDCDGNEGGG